MPTEVWNLFGQFGPMGLFVAYLIWDRSSGRTEQLQRDKDRSEADKALATALGALTAVIQRFDK